MSRSGYTDDIDDILAHGRWRGRVASAIRGKRGQALLIELAAAMDAMPVKELVAEVLEADGEFCTLGVLGAARGIDLSKLDPEDYDQVATAFGIAPCMAQEIVFENDERVDDEKWVQWTVCGPMRPWENHKRSDWRPTENAAANRWKRMRQWVADHLATTPKDRHEQ